MSNHHSASFANSGSRGLSRGLSWQEMRHKKGQDRWYERDGERSSLGEGSSQTYRLSSKVPKQEYHDRRDKELEHLCRLVRDLEVEVWGRRRRRNCGESPEGFVNTGDSR